MHEIKLKSGTILPLMNLKGKAYLQVAYRLVWFREEHPDWSIVTEFIYQDKESAFCKATIMTPTGQIMAVSHGEESSKDFAFGHREKSETKAIGRALALVGYGTQFEPEFDENERVVDSPLVGKVSLPNGAQAGYVGPEQPGPMDGTFDTTYIIPFGKFKHRRLEEVDLGELRSYIEYLEVKADKDGKKIVGQVAEFITRASELVTCFENTEAGALG